MELKILKKLDAGDDHIEVINIEFTIDYLVITVLIDSDKLDIRFDNPVGYRGLDEGNLLEFWPDCSTPGWLYEIENGGWYDQESKRSGFLAAHDSNIREFFVVGTDFCVSVLAFDGPTVNMSIH